MARMITELETRMVHSGLKGGVRTTPYLPGGWNRMTSLQMDLLTSSSSMSPAISLSTIADWVNDDFDWDSWRYVGNDWWRPNWSASIATFLPQGPVAQSVAYHDAVHPAMSTRLDGTWTVTIADLGPRAGGPWAFDYHTYDVRVMLDETEVLAATAQWTLPPVTVKMSLHTFWVTDIVTYERAGPWQEYVVQNPGAGVGRTKILWQSEMAGETRYAGRVYEWGSSAELRDWSLIAGAWGGWGPDGTAQVVTGAPGEIVEGKLCRPPVYADGWHHTQDGYWIYQIGGIQGGDCCGMWTDGMGVTWRCWWENGHIYVSRIDNPATDAWTSQVEVGEMNDCGGVGITGDGRIMYVTAVETSAVTLDLGVASYQWKSLDGGETWEGPVTI